MVFLYATTVSLVKLIFYVKNKKAVENLKQEMTMILSFSTELSETTHSVGI